MSHARTDLKRQRSSACAHVLNTLGTPQNGLCMPHILMSILLVGILAFTRFLRIHETDEFTMGVGHAERSKHAHKDRGGAA